MAPQKKNSGKKKNKGRRPYPNSLQGAAKDQDHRTVSLVLKDLVVVRTHTDFTSSDSLSTVMATMKYLSPPNPPHATSPILLLLLSVSPALHAIS